MINTLEPLWNQTFQYSPLSSTDIRTRALELTICDYDHFLSNEFLGATIIELNSIQLDDEPEWYCLSTREDLQQQLRLQWTKHYYKLIGTSGTTAETSTGTTSGVVATATAGSGLSPPTHSAHTSISARLSDSDVASELSMDDFDSKGLHFSLFFFLIPFTPEIVYRQKKITTYHSLENIYLLWS